MAFWITKRKKTAMLIMSVLFLFGLQTSIAQTPADDTVSEPDDARIAARLTTAYALLDALAGVEVRVDEGIVLLSGTVSNENQAARALSLATQIPGVFAVEDGIQRRFDVEGNLTPLVTQLSTNLGQWIGALPLFGLAVLLFALVTYLGYTLARWSSLWRRLTPNSFVAELIGQAVRAVSVLIGLVVALNLLGATTVMATLLGGAGVAGLAVGFAVRETIENYISSIMLSLRQPFRANDHVVINEHEGKVVRLTSRATILMTLSGNQLRIPNSTVFKAVILNYTHNPERRFEFELGIDADDDPIAAIELGVETLVGLPFVLVQPKASAVVNRVGDSSIILTFMGWIDQQKTDFGRARSLAISATKIVLEKEGFTLPEPVYKIRIDDHTGQPSDVDGHESNSNTEARPQPLKRAPQRQRAGVGSIDSDIDVKPDNHLEKMVNDERAAKEENDLLDANRPIE
ncbi:MAG: mechanosensitive ion channel family protein [Pseudohongiella sp.]|uniref:mechanosensitive ion channel domain-containing protein n=1 Tax=Pseudohongiella sp. TaxID=1979412 RepID=UPI0034A017E8